MATQDELLDALKNVMDPEIGKNIVELGMVRDLTMDGNGKVTFTLALTTPKCPLKTHMAAEARKALGALDDVKEVDIQFGEMSQEEKDTVFKQAQSQLPAINQFNLIGQVIAVMSGKGGVGKSSVTAMLATALKNQGQKVGVLDADVTGPSIPKMFGLPPGGVRGSDQGMLPSVTEGGIKVISTNLLLKQEDMPVIWRGPVISGTINQFWTKTIWGRLDTLLVDLPPGTSDATLTVLQTLPLNGVVLVTTPQELASMVVRKAVHMVKQLNVPILGVVENMSYFKCPDCGSTHTIFGESHTEEIVELANAGVSARLPLNPKVSELCDAGRAEEVHLPELESLAEQLAECVPEKA